MRVRPLTPAAVVAALAERITALPSAGQATRVLIDGAPPAAPGTVLLLDGTMLLGLGLAAELVVHLHLSAAALRRGTPTELAWTLPAYARYAEEVAPECLADVVVRPPSGGRPSSDSHRVVIRDGPRRRG